MDGDGSTGWCAAQAMVSPGAVVLLPPKAHIDRYAYVICVDDDPAACAARLDWAAAQVGLKMRVAAIRFPEEYA